MKVVNVIFAISTVFALLHCASAQSCSSINCAGYACCPDEVLGPVCIYQPSLYTCASGVRLCGTGEGVCNTVCYDASMYYCNNGVITQLPSGATTAAPTTAAPTTSAPTTSAPNSCTNYDRCGPNPCCPDEVLGPLCYNPALYTCASGVRLCGSGQGVCGTACYDQSMYYCNNGVITQLAGGVTTAAPTTAAPTTSSPVFNCPGVNDVTGVNCGAGSTCCGAGTITPSCLADNSGLQCCVWFLSSTQCNAADTCGGNLGYGASSQATCGPPGTIFCNAGDAINSFCYPDQLCCKSQSQYSYCCSSNQTCDISTLSCTAGPTSAPTTPAPTSCTNYDQCGPNPCCPDEVLGPVCYNPALYTCASGVRLCGTGQGVCGTACYDQSMYYCDNGVITQIQ